jgi:hypothetical protein
MRLMYVQRVSVNPSKTLLHFSFLTTLIYNLTSPTFSPPLQPKYSPCQFHQQFLPTRETLTKSTQIILSNFNIPCTKRVSQIQCKHKLAMKWRQLQLKMIPYLAHTIHSWKGISNAALHLGVILLEKPFTHASCLKTAHYRHPIHSRKNSLNPNLQQTSLSTRFCKQNNFQTHCEETRLGFIIPLDEEESLSELLELLELLLLP